MSSCCHPAAVLTAALFVTPAPAASGITSSDENGSSVREVEVHPAVRIDPTAFGGRRGAVRGGDCFEFSDAFLGVGTDPEADAPSGIVFSPDGGRILIPHRDTGNVVVFDADSRAVLEVIDVSGSPNDIAVSPDGTVAIVPNLFEDTVSILDLVNGVETDVIPVGTQPGSVAITPDGQFGLVGNTLDSSVSVIDLTSGVEVRELTGLGFYSRTSFGTWGIVFGFTPLSITPNGQTLVFPDLFEDRLQLVNINTGSVQFVNTAEGPSSVAWTWAGVARVSRRASTSARRARWKCWATCSVVRGSSAWVMTARTAWARVLRVLGQSRGSAGVPSPPTCTSSSSSACVSTVSGAW